MRVAVNSPFRWKRGMEQLINGPDLYVFRRALVEARPARSCTRSRVPWGATQPVATRPVSRSRRALTRTHRVPLLYGVTFESLDDKSDFTFSASPSLNRPSSSANAATSLVNPFAAAEESAALRALESVTS